MWFTSRLPAAIKLHRMSKPNPINLPAECLRSAHNPGRASSASNGPTSEPNPAALSNPITVEVKGKSRPCSSSTDESPAEEAARRCTGVYCVGKKYGYTGLPVASMFLTSQGRTSAAVSAPARKMPRQERCILRCSTTRNRNTTSATTPPVHLTFTAMAQNTPAHRLQ